MDRTESRAQLDICEGAEYDLENSRFEAHGSRRRCRIHCRKRTQLVTIVIFVFFLLIVMAILVAIFGPRSSDLEYKTAKYEGTGAQDGSGLTQSTPVSTKAPPITCANTQTQVPTTPAVAPDVSCDVAIVGAGIAGLYMAKVLTSNTSSKVCVFEKNTRLGGRIYDHHFASPNASVGLGAWGVEGNSQYYIGYDLVPELNIETQQSWDDSVYLHKSRGVTVAKGNDDLCDVLKANAFPSLSQRRFTNETCDNLIRRVTEDEKANAANFATAGTYLSNYLTSEGAKLISEYYGVKSDYLHLVKPEGYLEFLLGRRDEIDGYEYVWPTRGMSAFVKALEEIVLDQGGLLYLDNSVSAINHKGVGFHLQTTKHLVSASKVVLAVPPVSLAKIKGGVTEKVTHNAIYESIVSVPAFKGAALYSGAWWSDTLQPRQTFISYDDCLGVTMPHEARGENGEGILYTVYANGACAQKWGVLEEQSASALDKAVQRALEEKFNNCTIPTPLKTVYKYWEDGLHFQKAGSNYTEDELLRWAKRPVEGQDVYLVGDAYSNYGFLCEHALKSAAEVLLDVWKIPKPTDL